MSAAGRRRMIARRKHRRWTEPLLALLVSGLLSLATGACGTSGEHTGSSTHASPGAQAGGAAATNARAGAVRSSGYLNDQDEDIGGVAQNSGYHDPDDVRALALGHPARASTARTIAAVVERYYAVATAGDGRRACSMLLPSIARAVPVDYGGSSSAAPEYLRGQKTCPAIMTLIFKRLHSMLGAPVAVTRVLVNGAHASALLGSTAMGASYISLQREHGTWRIGGLLSGTMP
jgi:hypothetical protein